MELASYKPESDQHIEPTNNLAAGTKSQPQRIIKAGKLLLLKPAREGLS
jgi:hypothetical protein